MASMTVKEANAFRAAGIAYSKALFGKKTALNPLVSTEQLIFDSWSRGLCAMQIYIELKEIGRDLSKAAIARCLRKLDELFQR